MIGHRVWLAARERLETWVTIRQDLSSQPWLEIFDSSRLIPGVSANDPHSLDRALELSRPDVVFNAIGLIKQRAGASDSGAAFQANSFVPHFLRARCDVLGARLVHVSTDCVFTGTRGNYSESDVPDALDVYGLTKRLGEIGAPHLTIRTSAIGRSLAGSAGLLEWLLGQQGAVSGWTRAFFSGLGTPTLADTIVAVITEHTDLAGVWHVAAPRIDKFTLISRLCDAFSLPVTIEPEAQPAIDRSLNDERFRHATGIARPGWDEMVGRLASDPLPYDQLRMGDR